LAWADQKQKHDEKSEHLVGSETGDLIWSKSNLLSKTWENEIPEWNLKTNWGGALCHTM
jgi:hypothetical protein